MTITAGIHADSEANMEASIDLLCGPNMLSPCWTLKIGGMLGITVFLRHDQVRELRDLLTPIADGQGEPIETMRASCQEVGL